MEFQSYGDETGKLVFYFHGAPGAIKEAVFLADAAKQQHLHIISLHRFSIDSEILDNAYYQLLSDVIVKHMDTHVTQPKKVDLIGFSIGTHVALEVGKCLGDKVQTLHLVSAAAPLEAGDFLDNMAGKPVFQLAQKAPSILKLLTYWQYVLMKISPNIVFNMLFASAQGRDKDLMVEPEFRSAITGVLDTCFSNDRAGYVRDVISYITPWQDRLSSFKAPTHLWHGGSDNWSPVSMAHLLENQLPNCVAKHELDGASHYSCLLESSASICKAIAEQS